MPELPEVATVVSGLQDLLIGHAIDNVEADWPKSLKISESQIGKFLISRRVVALRRIGKMILIDLDSGYTLIVHLKMTGQLVYRRMYSNQQPPEDFGAGHPSGSLIAQLPDKTTRVIFYLDKQAVLYFNDVRKFGWIKLLHTNEVDQADLITSLGPDALTISCKIFIQILLDRRKNIKACLLDQTLIAGCGNIYADESLWLSKIHPGIAACELTVNQLGKLHRNMQGILRFSIEQGGSSSRNYINASGEKGKYLNFVNVYQRKGLPCSRCQNIIERIIVAGRGTHLCPVCQKI